MKCEWPKCKRGAEHEVMRRGEVLLNLCGFHRMEYLRDGLPKEKADVQASEVGGQAGKDKGPVVPALSPDSS